MVEYEQLILLIRRTLLEDETIRKLLFYNDKDALDKTVPAQSQIEKQIVPYPIIMGNEEDIYAQFITVSPEEIYIKADEEINIVVSVGVHKNNWFLNSNKMRAYQLVNRLGILLNGKKFNVAGKLQKKYIGAVYYTPDVLGFSVAFQVVNNIDRITDF